jgi:phage host-nuclease inhibitor protein Gam
MQADMAIVAPTQPRCPDEFTYSDKTKSCYLFGTDRISWRMARERCQVLGTDLVAIETGKEQKAIMDLARQEPGQ